MILQYTSDGLEITCSEGPFFHYYVRRDSVTSAEVLVMSFKLTTGVCVTIRVMKAPNKCWHLQILCL